MKVIFENGSSKELKFEGSLKNLFNDLDLNYEEYLVSRLGEVLTDDSLILDTDSLELISVISGG